MSEWSFESSSSHTATTTTTASSASASASASSASASSASASAPTSSAHGSKSAPSSDSSSSYTMMTAPSCETQSSFEDSEAQVGTGVAHKETKGERDERLAAAYALTPQQLGSTLGIAGLLPLLFVGLVNAVTMADPDDGLWANWFFLFIYFQICFQLFGIWALKLYENLIGLDIGTPTQIFVWVSLPGYFLTIGLYLFLSEAIWKFPVPIGSLIASGPFVCLVIAYALWRSSVRGVSARAALYVSAIIVSYLFVFMVSVVFFNVIRSLREDNAPASYKLVTTIGYTLFSRALMAIAGFLAASLDSTKRDEADLTFYGTVSWYKVIILSEIPEIEVFASLLVFDLVLVVVDIFSFTKAAHSVRSHVKTLLGRSTKPYSPVSRFLTRGPTFVIRLLIQCYVPVFYAVVYSVLYYGPNRHAFIVSTTPSDDVVQSMYFAAITFVFKIAATFLAFSFVNTVVPDIPLVALAVSGIRSSLVFTVISIIVSFFIVTKFLLYHTAAYADTNW